jgi:thymidine kinase
MYGGKTSYLMHVIETNSHAVRVLYINYDGDSERCGDRAFYTHNTLLDVESSEKLKNVVMTKAHTLSEISDECVRDFSVVCIDEAQFFIDLPEKVTHWAEVLGIDIYVAGLNGNAKRKNFGRIHELLPLISHFVTLQDTLCKRCSVKGHRVKALFSHNFEDNGQVVQIGAKQYIPVCRGCWLDLNTK